jgi:S1-C subfamily serine protease
MVLTAAHVVASAKSTRSSIVDGEKRTVTEFEEIDVVKELRQDGRRVGEITMSAVVVRYSDAREGEDLALLVLRKRDYSESSIEFMPGEDIVPVGTHLYHVGSLLGQFGSNSMTDGLVSQVGRTLSVGNGAGTTFDQVSCIAWPGSSGGGVFISDQHEDESMHGKLVGLLVRGAGNGGGGFAFIVPARRIYTWAHDSDASWLLDPKVQQPCLDDIYKAPMGSGSEAGGYADSDVDEQNFLFLDN